MPPHDITNRPSFYRVLRPPTFYGILRVRTESDGRLVPLSYGVGTAQDFDQARVVPGEYTFAFCVLEHARTVELACYQLAKGLRWFEPLLRGAVPDARFAEETKEL